MSLAPVRAWLRLDLGRRRRSLIALALLVALASGTAIVVTAGRPPAAPDEEPVAG